MLENAPDKKEFINYCANHFVISNIAGSHCDITMNDCYIGVVHKGSNYKDSYPVGFGLYTCNHLPRLLFKYDISKVESYKDFDKKDEQQSNVACIGFSESQQGWLGWSHRACFFFKIGYVVKEGSSCTETGWIEEYEKQHPERCFNLPVGFTCKTLDDCRKCAIAYAMALA